MGIDQLLGGAFDQIPKFLCKLFLFAFRCLGTKIRELMAGKLDWLPA
jgi:hypothetical protein